MNEASRPVAVRVIRPYESEDEYLAKEADSISKTTIELIGAHSRPQGVILRFEVTLHNGKTMVRGEGRVTSFNASGRDGQPSLSLRFTKLDPKSKALVDRAVLIRNGEPAPPAPPTPSPSADALRRASAPALDSAADDAVAAAADGTPTPAPGSLRSDSSRHDSAREASLAVTAQPGAVRPSSMPPGQSRRSDAPPPLPSALGAVVIPASRPMTLSPPPPFTTNESPTVGGPPPSSPPSSPPPASARTSPPTSPPPSGRLDADARVRDDRPTGAPTAPPPPESPTAPPPSTPPRPSSANPAGGASDGNAGAAARIPSARRDALLEKLRARGQALAPEERARILASKSRASYGKDA